MGCSLDKPPVQEHNTVRPLDTRKLLRPTTKLSKVQNQNHSSVEEGSGIQEAEGTVGLETSQVSTGTWFLSTHSDRAAAWTGSWLTLLSHVPHPCPQQQPFPLPHQTEKRLLPISYTLVRISSNTHSLRIHLLSTYGEQALF